MGVGKQVPKGAFFAEDETLPFAELLLFLGKDAAIFEIGEGRYATYVRNWKWQYHISDKILPGVINKTVWNRIREHLSLVRLISGRWSLWQMTRSCIPPTSGQKRARLQ
ncbi:hypothetical protein AVEN_182949-1 [Araneus ventricosus]|uniref:Uncharacterized protein n=1 Tax=Araneus ventricosus TaxID=182803 RepID=A0A4Y2GX41_ARAVE|nr:hypothetical protein AVEN_1857-1 [Araneus ventricosus]GBM57500.1 hypothetical protein AVEN_45479-1 [Araneus ventricosus]GBM57521.1 hypothetical protein AVEN_140063-1 [Araneus ventricosus]GBM57530.1 hypothetical protein AVEN_182949-1 [Araneus ventricosus]